MERSAQCALTGRSKTDARKRRCAPLLAPFNANVRAQKCPKVDSWSVSRTVRSHVRTFAVTLSKHWIREFRSAFIGRPKTRRLIPMLVFSDLSPNSAPHRDGREAAHFGQLLSAPARGRER